MLETFHVSIFQYDAHLEFRFPERREEHDGGVAHLCTVDGTDQREGYCAWASLRSGGVEIQFSSNIGDAHHHAVDARTEDAVVLVLDDYFQSGHYPFEDAFRSSLPMLAGWTACTRSNTG